MAGLDRFVIKKLRNSACEIMWQVFPMRSEGFSSATYTGQGGLVRGPDGTVKFLTAAHNTCSENDREGVWEDHSRKFRCFTFRGLSARMLEIPRAGWERTEEWSAANAHGLTRTDKEGKELTWKYGIDISLGPEISASDESAQQLLKIISVKDVVPDDFVYTTGLEIGMAVYTVDGPNYDEEMIVNRGQKGLTKEVLPDILGKAKELLIFTGRIKRFYEDHFEHDVNAFAGCSGGHLVVLQHGHPHFGKVLGVHVGSKVQIEDNIAFKVAGVFDKF
ncbi:expressed unknown protein [Seminavis robusta]|uniref:Serine protease n=1 Tax=Seminavis robusta TaxID=568900 RepID=A0A9N8HXN7_9STRA|nr:expressed unknown protein [Seminavis robusta]|eukprot:Sro2262_g321190.1 n/a (276) ;mRNA; r:4295-5122